MPLRAVTFDFHDTLVQCDEWFQLEVRELVPALLGWAAERDFIARTEQRHDEAVARYRAIRMQVIASGVERDAPSCALQVLSELGVDLPEEKVRVGIDELMRAALASAAPHAGARETVQELAEAGIALGVVSSAAHHAFLEWSLHDFGMLDYFTTVITSAQCGHYKSTPRIYECVLAELGVAAHESVHVGDSLRFDVGSAGSIGIRTVWFNLRREPPDGIVPDLTVQSLVGLAPRILSMFAE